MNEWYESVDVNKLYFEYKGTKGVSFYIMIRKNYLIKQIIINLDLMKH